MADPISAGISAGAGVVTGAMSMIEAKKRREFEEQQAREQRIWNEDMMDKQNAWNFEMWQKQNAYNAPSQQVERMRDAGLNPMFYGLDGSSAGDVGSASPLGYERASASAYENPVSVGVDNALKVAQLSNIQADTAKKNQETLTEEQRREQIIQDVENAKQTLENLKSQKNLTDKQVEDLDKRIAWIDRLNEAIIDEKRSSQALNESQKHRIDELLEGEKLIQSKTVEDFDKRWNKIQAEINKMAKETGLLAKDIENYALNHATNGFMGTGLSFQNFIRMFKDWKPPKNVDFTSTDSVSDEYGNSD